MKKRFYSVNGQMMGYESGGVKKDFLTDHLGSITAEIDQNQNRTFETRYSAFGRNNWSTGTERYYSPCLLLPRAIYSNKSSTDRL